MIYAAAGGVGNIIVQIAKALDAYLIGPAAIAGIDLIKSLGVAETIGYKTEDFSQICKDVDVVIHT